MRYIDSRIKPAKNLIIEYEQPKAHHEQVVVDEGVFRADPQTHNATSTHGYEAPVTIFFSYLFLSVKYALLTRSLTFQ